MGYRKRALAATFVAAAACTGGGGDAQPAIQVSGGLAEYDCLLFEDDVKRSGNRTRARFNIGGADLGVPAVDGDTLHLFFGDTNGWYGHWQYGTGLDAVARIPLADVRADPTAVCRALEFSIFSEDPSVAQEVDPTVEHDFTGGRMAPPPGASISTYLAQPSGPDGDMPGVFEVPGGALARDGGVLVAYAANAELAPRARMTASHLVRWDDPKGPPSYRILRTIDTLANGALGGHFVQTSLAERDGFVYLFGTGDFRRSAVYLARVEASRFESGEGEALFDAASGRYREAASLTQPEREGVAPIFETTGVGELSVSWVEEAGAWVALYQRELLDGNGWIVDNRVLLRVAARPEGPWSAPVTLLDMGDPTCRQRHCCAAEGCSGTQVLNCDRAGFYGAYLLPAASRTASGEVALPFLVSTWDPYGVALFTARLRVSGQ